MPAPRLVEHFEDIEKQSDAARLGVWVFLASETLLFGALLALYASYRVMYPADFLAAAAHNNVAIGTTNTLVLITSSLTVALAVNALRRDLPRLAGWLLAASVALGAAFLVLKGFEYAEHAREGIVPGRAYRFAEMPSAGASLFFTLYYCLTALHGLHVAGGMLLLAYFARGCFRGRYDAEGQLHVELGGLYWHLVDIVWIFLWPLLYLSHTR
ncbi:MAG: cytochrome c oxidase subunit 3 family protein [Polyangiaceae bacterium]|nr:cytochrome c oxidase subunit 3 family protein [Polyangiaceae bacterium]